jgi:hypothetical protein
VPQTLPNAPAHIPEARLRLRLDVPVPLRLWHLTSLDAPTVAVTWSLAFAWAAQVHLPLWAPALLALAAWSVYIGDRLLDARSARRADGFSALRDRHRFHHRHRRLLLPVAVAAALAAAWIVFTRMPIAARERNSILVIAALAYFTGVHSADRLPSLGIFRLLKKELLVGLLFTAACVLPAIRRVPQQDFNAAIPLWVDAAFFALLAWLNCHAIEGWESSTDVPRIQVQASLLALGGLALTCALEAAHPRPAALLACGAASSLLLALLDRFRNRLTPLALRAAADLVLLTPLLLLA